MHRPIFPLSATSRLIMDTGRGAEPLPVLAVRWDESVAGTGPGFSRDSMAVLAMLTDTTPAVTTEHHTWNGFARDSAKLHVDVTYQSGKVTVSMWAPGWLDVADALLAPHYPTDLAMTEILRLFELIEGPMAFGGGPATVADWPAWQSAVSALGYIAVVLQARNGVPRWNATHLICRNIHLTEITKTKEHSS